MDYMQALSQHSSRNLQYHEVQDLGIVCLPEIPETLQAVSPQVM